MKTKQLAEILERVESWPAHAQDELAEIARDIEQGLNGGDYQPTDAELAGIDRGLRDADQGRFAAEAEVEAVFAKFSRR
jgi:predicted transcriptional regulator